MKLEGVVHCEGPDCRVHQHVGVPNMNAGRLPAGWVRTVEYGDAGECVHGYCGHDCVMKASAQFDPPLVVE